MFLFMLSFIWAPLCAYATSVLRFSSNLWKGNGTYLFYARSFESVLQHAPWFPLLSWEKLCQFYIQHSALFSPQFLNCAIHLGEENLYPLPSPRLLGQRESSLVPSVMGLQLVMQCWAWTISLRMWRSTEQDEGLPQWGYCVSGRLGEEVCCSPVWSLWVLPLFLLAYRCTAWGVWL